MTGKFDCKLYVAKGCATPQHRVLDARRLCTREQAREAVSVGVMFQANC